MQFTPVSYTHLLKFTDDKGNTGLGIYQNQTASSRVDFLYSTKGLTGVESVEMDVRAFGNVDLVNRKIDWTYDVYVYDMSGEYVGQMVSDLSLIHIFTRASKHL